MDLITKASETPHAHRTSMGLTNSLFQKTHICLATVSKRPSYSSCKNYNKMCYETRKMYVCSSLNLLLRLRLETRVKMQINVKHMKYNIAKVPRIQCWSRKIIDIKLITFLHLLLAHRTKYVTTSVRRTKKIWKIIYSPMVQPNLSWLSRIWRKIFSRHLRSVHKPYARVINEATRTKNRVPYQIDNNKDIITLVCIVLVTKNGTIYLVDNKESKTTRILIDPVSSKIENIACIYVDKK